MKKTDFLYKLFLLFLLTSLLLPINSFAADIARKEAKPPSKAMEVINKMKFKPINFQVPKVGEDIERVKLKNGMILYLKEDHRFPVVRIRGVVRTGQAYEKKECFGVAYLTGKVMRTGGTKNFSPKELNEELEFLATTLESNIGIEKGSIYLNVISSKLDKGMNLFSQVLRYPAFDNKELELAKSQIREKLLRENENPWLMVRREFYKILYPNYPLGWQYDWNFIKNIKSSDLAAWHNKFYSPNNMMFAVVGDFNKKDMIKKFNNLFSDWKQKKVNYSGFRKVTKTYYPGVYLIEKDLTQSCIRMGHLGIKEGNPDRYAIEVMNFILGGGGFNSWMTEKVRSDEGLAYTVGTYFALDSPVYGPFNAVCSTKSNTTLKASLLMKEIIEKIIKQKVTEKNLKWAKESLINSYLFKFENSSQITYNLLLLEYEKRPQNFYQNYVKNINKVKIEDVQKVARKYLHPNKMTIVIAGNSKNFDKDLEALGKVKKVKLRKLIFK